MSEEKNWYDKYYKKILIFSVIVLLVTMVYLGYFFLQNGDIIYKDVSLTGGTTITVLDGDVDLEALREVLSTSFPDSLVRGISDIRTGQQEGFFVETSAEPSEITATLEDFLGYELTIENSSIEFTGSTISEGFYKQLRFAMALAFLFMALVVFIIFKTPIPSLAVIISAFADILMTIALLNILGISLSTGGIVALLMLVGYSVDTDILLTTRVLRKKGESVNQRMFGALKTGATMTLTSLVAVLVALIVIYSFSDALRQIFLVLSIGLAFDLFNTWTANASILKWYAEAKGIK